MPLERELETFRVALPSLLAEEANRGKFALVQGGRVDSLWATEDEALAAGYDRFGPEPFLVKKVAEHEESVYLTLRASRCP